MGHHFVPQAYLRGFEDPFKPGFIWVHARRDPKPRSASIVDVAQSRDFYDAETEALLASATEAPANPILAKLRTGETPSDRERVTLAVYLATMIKRVPRNRTRGRAMAPKVLEDVVNRFRDQVRQLAELGELSPNLATRRLQELEVTYAKFTHELPEPVADQIRDPRPSIQMIQAIAAMRWRVLRTAEPEFFITSDNPAFYHEAYGLGTEQSELRFPLSPQLALHGCRAVKARQVVSIHDIPREWVREFNRSVASGASSIGMSHRPAHFLGTLLRRKNPYLFRLGWDAA
jgi:hypothetical protein